MRRGENRSTRRKTSRSRLENQQTQPTYDAESGNRTRATLVGGECSTTAPSLLPPLLSTGDMVQFYDFIAIIFVCLFLFCFKDLNECTTNLHNCDPNAICYNYIGGFGCRCNSGYAGNGRTCSGKTV